MTDGPGTLAMTGSRPLLIAAIVDNLAMLGLALASLRVHERWLLYAFAACLLVLLVIAGVALARRGPGMERWFAPLTAAIWIVIGLIAL